MVYFYIFTGLVSVIFSVLELLAEQVLAGRYDDTWQGKNGRKGDRPRFDRVGEPRTIRAYLDVGAVCPRVGLYFFSWRRHK